MGFWEHEDTFDGKQVIEYDPTAPLPDPSTSAPRLMVEYDSEETVLNLLSQLLQDPKADQLTTLVIGAWSSEMFEAPPSDLVEALVASAARLPSLKSLFFGDIISEECEVSWIESCDLSPFWEAFPKLELLKIRGTNQLSLGKIEHRRLKSLIIESGGLDTGVLNSIWEASLPELEHLQVYLGSDNYGWNGSVEDVEPILSGKLFPKLKYLGLCDSEIADEIAVAVAKSPILSRLEVLDLSSGTLGDVGARALLDSPSISKLKKLDLHYHYISDGVQAQLRAIAAEVDLSNPQSGDEDDRYVAVGE